MIGAIVLAAGASARMRSPKALLTITGKTFLQHIVEMLAAGGVSDVVIVLGADAGVIRESLGWYSGKCVINAQWKSGQLSSALAGLRAIVQPNLEGVFLCPVDRPLLSVTVISGMLRLFHLNHKNLVVPVLGKKRGHPLLIGSKLFSDLEHCSPLLGVREILWKHPDEILEYATEEEGVLTNIDTPDDYRRKVTP